MSQARKVVRYFVQRHQNRDGTLSRRIWDVREITMDEWRIEHVESKMGSFPTRKEAEEYAAAMNKTVSAMYRLSEDDRRRTINAAIAAFGRRLK